MAGTTRAPSKRKHINSDIGDTTAKKARTTSTTKGPNTSSKKAVGVTKKPAASKPKPPKGSTAPVKAAPTTKPAKGKAPVKSKTTAAKASATPSTSKEPVKTSAKTGSKRKTRDDEDDRDATPPPKKARAPPKVKEKATINQIPTQRLDVYVCGEGSSGELGLGVAKNAIDVKRPRLNANLSAREVGVVNVACGGMHAAALTYDNRILTWGVNDLGALGRSTEWEGRLRDADDEDSDDDMSDSGLNPYESTPTAIPSDAFPEGTKFVKLAAGDSVTLALTDDGLVYGWGTFRVSLWRLSLP